MKRLKTVSVAALAAMTIAVGGLATAPTASAMPKSTCLELARLYLANAAIFNAIGASVQAAYWAGRADGIMDSCS